MQLGEIGKTYLFRTWWLNVTTPYVVPRFALTAPLEPREEVERCTLRKLALQVCELEL